MNFNKKVCNHETTHAATQNEFINETISLVSEKVFLEGRLNFIP